MIAPLSFATLFAALPSPQGRALPRFAPPGGGGLTPLASQGAQRPRRLGRKGEGVTLAKFATGVQARRVSPSPRFSKLAALVKRTGPPPPGGRGRRPVVEDDE